MAIDLSQAMAAEMRVNRLYLTDDATLVFEEADADVGYITRITLDQDDDWDSQAVDNTQNETQYLVIRVLDYSGFETLFRKCNSVTLEGYRYAIKKRFPPKGATRIWTLRCELTNERV